MSNSLAIAAVTATLQRLLDNAVKDVMTSSVEVSTKPPGKVRQGGDAPNQLNLFLYQVEHSGAWQNQPMPPGHDGMPPLALMLYYLLSAYGEGEDDLKAHTLLGYAMGALHDTPTLSPRDIKDALDGNDLYQQIEQIHITRQPISTDEMSKLWSTFQADYRVSVAYQVSVVLIESRRTAQAALPILQRGSKIDEQRDEGVVAVAETIPPFPTIEDIVELSRGRPSVPVDTMIHIQGHHLNGKKVFVRFSSPRLKKDAPDSTDFIEREAVSTTDSEVTVDIPDDNSLPAGVYTVAVVAVMDKQADPTTSYEVRAVSNEAVLGIAPQITSTMPLTVNLANGGVTLILQCKPTVSPEQRVSLFLGGREVRAEKRNNVADPLTFKVTLIEPGEYRVRLRVDGVDSYLVDTSGPIPKFDDTQKVTIQ